MTPEINSPRIKKSFLILFSLLSIGAGVFAAGATPSEKLLHAFKESFPHAEQVKWTEAPNKYMVNFMNDGIAERVEYDKDENLVSTTRYYDEKGLPEKIDRRLHKKFPGMQVSGVTEVGTELDIYFYIKLEDATNLVTVKASKDGNLETLDQLKKGE